MSGIGLIKSRIAGNEFRGLLLAALVVATAALSPARAQNRWPSYAHDPQHTATSPVASQCINGIRWQTPVDLFPQYSGPYLLIHYGSPLITAANTVIVPVKTGTFGGYRVEARNGADGSLIWMQSTNYVLPPHYWTPSYAPVLTPSDRLYFAGIGGTVYYRDTPDSPVPAASGQLAFYGLSNYQSNPTPYNNFVFINTPITTDDNGNIYFGFQITGTTPIGSAGQGGIARISAAGVGTWVTAATAASDSGMTKVVHNCAPAISADGTTLYVGVNNGGGNGFGTGYLLALNSITLARIAKVALKDPKSGSNANLNDSGTASPTVGPDDGDVYYGVLENGSANNSRGWLLHFTGNLATAKIPGAFGWDDTASIVPASMVPSYNGASTYLVMTKYNNYAGAGGDGVNRIAVLDPNAGMTDPVSGATVMKEVLTIAGVTPDTDFPDYPNAVREWCINTAAVDPATKSILANNEDGKLYRWDMTTNSFTQVVTLTSGVGEAYTPTVIGVDGTVYAINNAILFAVNHVFAADMNCDTRVDNADFDLFLPCLTGADSGPPAAGCEGVDFDHDNDVDQEDFARFQNCISGTAPADPHCAD